MDEPARYQIKRKVSSGGTATVYLAEDAKLKREVALKLVHPHLLDNPNTIKRLEVEARAIAALSHENVVKLFDFGEMNGTKFLVMEYIDGGTLLDVLQEHPKLPNLVVAELMVQIFSALAAAHEKGICHRDVKPSNLIVDREGRVKIMDFGIAYVVNRETLTMTGALMGTPNYISPEQVSGRATTGKADVFSMGSLAYQCLAGKPPFDANNVLAILHSIANDTPAPLSTARPSVLPWLAHLVHRCLQKDPDARPSAAECIQVIEKECASDGIVLGRKRIASFLEAPPAASSREDDDLWTLYRQKARHSYRQRQYPACVRNLQVAAAFKCLDREDERLLARIGRRTHVSRTALLACAAIVVVLLAWGLGPVVHRHLAARAADQPVKSTVPRAATEGAPQASLAQDDTALRSLSARDPIALTTPSPIPTRDRHGASLHVPTQPVTVQSSPDSVTSVPPRPGFLAIRTNPPWATIVVDGIERGQTPRSSVVPAEPGIHSLLIRKEGFKDHTEQIRVESQDTTRRMVALQPSAIAKGK